MAQASDMLETRSSAEDIENFIASMYTRPVMKADENGGKKCAIRDPDPVAEMPVPVGTISPADAENAMPVTDTGEPHSMSRSHLTSPPTMATLHQFTPSPSSFPGSTFTSALPADQAASTRSSQTPSNPHQPGGAMPRNPDNLKSQPSLLRHSTSRQIRATRAAAQPYPMQANHIIYTDDVSTKLSDRVRRKCYNCHTTDTSSWRRSDRTPGKVLCNKCGLFERTRFHAHLVRNPRPVSIRQFKPQHRNTPPPLPATTGLSIVQPGGRWDTLGMTDIGAGGAQSACSDGQVASSSADDPSSPQQYSS